MKCYVPVEEQAWNTRFGWECFDNVIEVIRPEESRWIYLPDMLNKEKKIEKFVKQNFETDNFIAKGCYYKKYIPLVVPDNLKKSNKLYVRTTFIEYGDYGDDVAGAVWVLRDNKLYNEEMMKEEYKNIKKMCEKEYRKLHDIDHYFVSFKIPERFWELYREEQKQKEEIKRKIEETKTVVTHFGDDLDNKSAIYALEKWAKENKILKEDESLQVDRVPAGKIKEGMLNVDTGGHKGSRQEGETIVIDGDPANGVKSASEALNDLGIYVPEQIVELADTVPNKVSALDSRSGLALVRYLRGEQTFKLAEKRLLDKKLTDEQLAEFELEEAHEKQQKIIDNAVEKIEKYTKELQNGEKIVLAPEQIIGGSAIAYEMGIPYYASATEHVDQDKKADGVTFAITSKPGTKLPEEILEYGKELVEEYRIDENTSGVFVNPNGQMIVAGGFKNPEFKIPNETIKGMLNKIESKFKGKDIEKNRENQTEH